MSLFIFKLLPLNIVGLVMEIHSVLYLKPLHFKETLFVSMKHCYTDDSRNQGRQKKLVKYQASLKDIKS